jgi:hypothetical protein
MNQYESKVKSALCFLYGNQNNRFILFRVCERCFMVQTLLPSLWYLEPQERAYILYIVILTHDFDLQGYGEGLLATCETTVLYMNVSAVQSPVQLGSKCHGV